MACWLPLHYRFWLFCLLRYHLSAVWRPVQTRPQNAKNGMASSYTFLRPRLTFYEIRRMTNFRFFARLFAFNLLIYRDNFGAAGGYRTEPTVRWCGGFGDPSERSEDGAGFGVDRPKGELTRNTHDR